MSEGQLASRPPGVVVRNATRNTILADRARWADTFFSRLRGLMFTDPLPPGAALILDPCNSVHMFFMGYPLDVVFLDKKKRLSPWSRT